MLDLAAGPSSRRSLVLATLCVALFMAMLDNTVVNVALPSIQRQLGPGFRDLQWIVDAYSLVFASLMLTASTIQDIYGRKKTFLAGLAMFVAGSSTCALASGTGMLIAGRFVQGIGAAAFIPGTLSIIRHVFTDERERGTAIGVWAGISGLGVGLGPAVGGLMVGTLGWPSVFWLNVPVGVLGLVAGAVILPESSDPVGRHIDVPGQVLGITAIGGIVFATIEGPSRGWTSPVVLGVYTAAALAGVAFVAVEWFSSSPMLQVRLFADRVFTGAILSGFAVYFGMFAIAYFLSIWVQVVLGFSPLQGGLAMLPAMLTAALIAPVAGMLAGRVGSAPPLGLGLGLSSFCLYCFTWYGEKATYSQFWWLLPLLGAGLGLTLTPITAAVLSRVPPERAGMGSAASNTARELGGVLGVAVLGSVLVDAMRAQLIQSLDHLRVAAPARDAVVSAVVRESGHSEYVTRLPPAIRAAVLHAYVVGLHRAEAVGAVLLAVVMVLALVLVRAPRGYRTSVVVSAHEHGP